MSDVTNTQAMADGPVPEGFAPLDFGGNFMRHVGPLYVRTQGAELSLGFRVRPQHVNPAKQCHGGMLAAFCDTLLLATAHHAQPDPDAVFFPTIGLQLDYLAGAPLGAWVQGEARILRQTRSMAFIQGLVSVGDQLCVRTSGVFKFIAAAPR